jgi:hypothetical protein
LNSRAKRSLLNIHATMVLRILLRMKDLTEKLEKLRADAEDCFLISKLATDKEKRELFARLAAQLRRMAEDVEVAIANKVAGGERSTHGPTK